MSTRLNNFQNYLARNNPKFNVNRNRQNVHVTRKNTNINKLNLFANFRNTTRGNTLTVQTLYTNKPLTGRGYQKKFVRAAEKAARKAGYKSLNATSMYMVFIGNNNVPKKNNEPSSYYLLNKLGFKKVSTKGKRGVYNLNNKNRYTVYMRKLLT
jgi:L-amino acid N-acyltransferase YncA